MSNTKKVIIFDSYDDKYLKQFWDNISKFDIRIIDTSKKENVINEYNTIITEYLPLRPKIYTLKKNLPQQLSGKILILSEEDLFNLNNDV